MSKKSIVVSKVSEGHDNPIAELVQVACKFDSEITLESDNRRINAKSIMGIMAFNPSEGMNVDIITKGDDEQEALVAIEKFLHEEETSMQKKNLKANTKEVKPEAKAEVKPEVKTVVAPEVKADVKAEVEKKVEKATEKAVEKAAETKEAVKKTAAKVTKAAKTAKATKKEPVKPEIIVQYQNNEVDTAKVEERVKAQFVSEGHKAGFIKKLNIYIKPEEYSAYYVINDKFSGRVDLF